MPAEFDPRGLIEALAAHGVRYVVVGGFAAWMHGAPVVTVDLDIVYDPRPDNVTNLVFALNDLEAFYRHQHGRRISPTVESFAPGPGAGHHLFTTRCGALDVLRTASGQDYDALRDDVDWIEIGGVHVALATLTRVIELKVAAGRPKDLAALPMLRAALEDRDPDED